MEQDDKTEHVPLRAIQQRINALNPLSGPNIMRRAAQIFRDNGDGTMTLRRQPPPWQESNAEEQKTLSFPQTLQYARGKIRISAPYKVCADKRSDKSSSARPARGRCRRNS